MIINTLELTGKLLERYEKMHARVAAYPGLLAYYALVQAGIEGNNEEYLNKAMTYLGQYPDHYDHPIYNFESYRAGGLGKALLVYKNYMPEHAEVLREYAEITMKAPTTPEGYMCAPRDEIKRRTWIDIVMPTTPFMLFAGLTFNEEKYIDFGADQCFKLYELFLDRTCGLLHQAIGFMPDPERMSADHWGRGNGWGLVGLAALVEYLPADSKHRPKAEKYLKDMMAALLPHQTARGLWRQELIEPLAWEECSGTGLILYAMSIGMRMGLLDPAVYKEPFEKGIAGLAACCLDEQFATHRSCPGCLYPSCPGVQPGSVQAYITGKLPTKDEPHSYGCIMLAMVEAHKQGITEVDILSHIR